MYELSQKLQCVVLATTEREHRYKVLIKADQVPAMLICIKPLKIGEEIVGFFVNESRGEILLSADLPELQKRSWSDRDLYESLNRARKLSLNEVSAMEAQIQGADLELRIAILGRLTGLHWKDDTIRARRTEQILWFVHNVPDHPILSEPEGQIIHDEPSYKEAKSLLLRMLDDDAKNVQLLRNVAMWTILEDDGTAEELLYRGGNLEPSDPSWSLFLSTLYGIRAEHCTDRELKGKWSQFENQEKARTQSLRMKRIDATSSDSVPSKSDTEDWQVSNAVDFKIWLDESIQRSGVPSICFKSMVVRPRYFGFISKSMPADSFAGKKLNLSVWIKTELTGGASAQLWLQVDGNWENRSETLDTLYENRVKGVSQWQRYEVSTNVPADSTNIVYSVLLNGTGTVWLNDLKLASNSSDT